MLIATIVAAVGGGLLMASIVVKLAEVTNSATRLLNVALVYFALALTVFWVGQSLLQSGINPDTAKKPGMSDDDAFGHLFSTSLAEMRVARHRKNPRSVSRSSPAALPAALTCIGNSLSSPNGTLINPCIRALPQIPLSTVVSTKCAIQNVCS